MSFRLQNVPDMIKCVWCSVFATRIKKRKKENSMLAKPYQDISSVSLRNFLGTEVKRMMKVSHAQFGYLFLKQDFWMVIPRSVLQNSADLERPSPFVILAAPCLIHVYN